MTIYQQIQQRIMQYDQALDDQCDLLTKAAGDLAHGFSRYLGIVEAGCVQLGVGERDSFKKVLFVNLECEAGGAGLLEFTIRLCVEVPVGTQSQWARDFPIQLSFFGTGYRFTVESTKKQFSLTPLQVQNCEFNEIYDELSILLMDAYDPDKVLRFQ